MTASQRNVDAIVAMALAGMASIVTCYRGARLGSIEFAVCAGLFLAAICLIAHGGNRREGFFDSAAETMRDLLLPKVELLARSFHSAEKDENAMNNETTGNEKDEGEDAELRVDDTYFNAIGAPASIIQALKLQYKRIGFFLCNLKDVDLDRYNKLISMFSSV